MYKCTGDIEHPTIDMLFRQRLSIPNVYSFSEKNWLTSVDPILTSSKKPLKKKLGSHRAPGYFWTRTLPFSYWAPQFLLDFSLAMSPSKHSLLMGYDNPHKFEKI